MPTARAVRIREPGEADVLELGEIEVRDPAPGEVLVKVAAAGLNRADVIQRRGFYPAPPGAPEDVPGLEYAGTVAAAGDGVQGLCEGDAVMGISGGGAMAEYLVVHEREVMPAPEGLPLEQAAAVPEVFLTAYDALVLQSGMSMGQTVLLHAVASGVGTAALQLAQLTGAVPIGTSRSADKLERCKELGLEHAVLVEEGEFAEQVKKASGGRGAEIVMDLVGAAYLEENLRAVAPKGRIIVVGLVSGVKATLPMHKVLGHRVRITGTVLRSRPLEEKAALTQRFAREVLPLLSSGRLRPVVDTTLPMAEVQQAHRRMEANDSFGKIVLAW